MTIQDFSFRSRRAKDCAPYLFCDWRCKCVPLRSTHGFAHRQKAASLHPAVGGRGKLVLYHHQLRAAGQKPTLPRRNWRCHARRHEINHERFVWHYGICLLMPDHLLAIIAFPRKPECKRLSGIGRSSSRENMAWIGNAIFSITACATVANWRRRLERFHKRCRNRPVAGLPLALLFPLGRRPTGPWLQQCYSGYSFI